ncbi:MAG TPA: hypothetical protein VEQ85_13120 [Lacipirellulaceae bacterium]|nr:hypothetical protein [Lacipirellulaceae bacterium]
MNTTCSMATGAGATPPAPSRSKTSPRERAEAEWSRLLAAAESRGFYGTAAVTLVVQDGHIQHVRVSTERMIR